MPKLERLNAGIALIRMFALGITGKTIADHYLFFDRYSDAASPRTLMGLGSFLLYSYCCALILFGRATASVEKHEASLSRLSNEV